MTPSAAPPLAVDRDQLIEGHAHLVPLTVKRHVPPGGIDREDLEGAGYGGLVQAAQQFDPARGVKFATYAISKIRGAILEYLRQEDWVPRSVRAQQKRGEEVALIRQVSLEAQSDDEDGRRLLDRLAAPDATPEAEALAAHETGRLQALIRWLPATERRLCILRYQEGLTLKEIAAQYDRSESRIYQIEQQALRRVRAWVRDRCHDQA